MCHTFCSLPEEGIKQITWQLLRAIEFCHANNVSLI